MDGTTPPIGSASGKKQDVKTKVKKRDVSPGIALRTKEYLVSARKPTHSSIATPVPVMPATQTSASEPGFRKVSDNLSGAEKQENKTSITKGASSAAMREKVDSAEIENASKLRSASTPNTFTNFSKNQQNFSANL